MTDPPLDGVSEFEIRPHVGVGPVLLGMTSEEVHRTFGSPDCLIRDNRESVLDGFFVDFTPRGAPS